MVQFGILLLLVAAHLTSLAQNDFEWTDASGKTRNRYDLEDILDTHKQWVESEQQSGSRADLSGAELSKANLSDASLPWADLTNAHLEGANLSRANLKGANLSEADLYEANLDGAELSKANLSDATLTEVNLSGKDLQNVKLIRAFLMRTNLSGAGLLRADLSGAKLNGANLSGADLDGADLGRALFEPQSVPELRGIAAANNLELLTYETNPDALVQLRAQFEDGGFREQERKITYALKRREAQQSFEMCRSGIRILTNCGSFALNKVFFDWTCQYGMSPGRPLILGLWLWLLCSLLYFGFIHTSGQAGLYRVYGQSVSQDPEAQRRVERVLPLRTGPTLGPRWVIQFFWHEWLLLRTSMFFSLMSAFNIGFRDINFGRWLRLLTRREFDIKAVGWARVVAGWQSLISVGLLALAVLTYFGRPFR